MLRVINNCWASSHPTNEQKVIISNRFVFLERSLSFHKPIHGTGRHSYPPSSTPMSYIVMEVGIATKQAHLFWLDQDKYHLMWRRQLFHKASWLHRCYYCTSLRGFVFDSLTHRGFLESAGRQNYCDHLNVSSLQQLPADSLTAWICMHVCRLMHSQSHLAAVEWGQSIQAVTKKIQCTKKGVRSLENLYGLT